MCFNTCLYVFFSSIYSFLSFSDILFLKVYSFFLQDSFSSLHSSSNQAELLHVLRRILIIHSLADFKRCTSVSNLQFTSTLICKVAASKFRLFFSPLSFSLKSVSFRFSQTIFSNQQCILFKLYVHSDLCRPTHESYRVYHEYPLHIFLIIQCHTH